MLKGKKKKLHSAFAMTSVIAVLVAALLLVVTMGAQYLFVRKNLLDEVNEHAQSALKANSYKIEGVIRNVEEAMHTMKAPIERNSHRPDSLLYEIMGNMVKSNDLIVSCAVAFEPGYRQKDEKWCEYAVLENDDGSLDVKQIGGASHDYFNMEWYREALNNNGHWSEPYYNGMGDGMRVVTYSTPIHDKDSDKTVGVLCADIKLEWLKEFADSSSLYPGSYNIILSREGQFLVYPNDSIVKNKRANLPNDRHPSVDELYRHMMAAESGHMEAEAHNGKKRLAYYAPIPMTNGWSMAIVVDKKMILAKVYGVTILLLALSLLALALLAFIVNRSMKDNRRLQEVHEKKARLDSELRIAGDIQQAMLPGAFPSNLNIELAAFLKPAREVGGDLYDWYLRDDKLYFIVGDVSGKGVPASLVMAVTRSLFRSVAEHDSNPAHIVTSINTGLTQINDNDMFVTLFIGVLDLPTGRLRYCNAGHDTPLLVTEKVEWLLVEPNLPVGLMADFEYKRQEMQLGTDTMLFFYTDGLTEAVTDEHDLFGAERMMKVVGQKVSGAPSELMAAMEAAVADFVGDADQGDDLTMLAIKYHPTKKEYQWQQALTLSCDRKQVTLLGDFMNKLTEELKLDDEIAMPLRLAVEEAVVNVMSYAYPPGEEGSVTVTAKANENELKLSIIDEGKAFDPTAAADAETRLAVEERSAGGLGIYLFRQLMDVVNYERVDGQNILTLTKYITNNN